MTWKNSKREVTLTFIGVRLVLSSYPLVSGFLNNAILGSFYLLSAQLFERLLVPRPGTNPLANSSTCNLLSPLNTHISSPTLPRIP